MLIVLIIIAVLVLLFIILYFYYNNREIALRKESEAQRGVTRQPHVLAVRAVPAVVLERGRAGSARDERDAADGVVEVLVECPLRDGLRQTRRRVRRLVRRTATRRLALMRSCDQTPFARMISSKDPL